VARDGEATEAIGRDRGGRKLPLSGENLCQRGHVGDAQARRRQGHLLGSVLEQERQEVAGEVVVDPAGALSTDGAGLAGAVPVGVQRVDHCTDGVRVPVRVGPLVGQVGKLDKIDAGQTNR